MNYAMVLLDIVSKEKVFALDTEIYGKSPTTCFETTPQYK